MGKVRKSEASSNESTKLNKLLKKKNDLNNVTHKVIHDAAENIDGGPVKKNKKIKLAEDEEIAVEKEVNEVQDNVVSSKRKKRNKRKAQETETTELPASQEPNVKVNRSKNEGGVKNKKIIFTNEGTLEKSVDLKTQKPTQTFLQGEEAEVRDEDIDKFCDELDEEDNVQFEDWVKQIEEKLHSNKNKTQ